MGLSLEPMKQGSSQVEMSDQGMMASDVEECLSVVISAVKRCDLPVVKMFKWCTAMLDHERVLPTGTSFSLQSISSEINKKAGCKVLRQFLPLTKQGKDVAW